MLSPSRRPRLRIILLIALASITSYYLLFSGPSPRFNIVPYLPEDPQGNQPTTPAPQSPQSPPIPPKAPEVPPNAPSDTESNTTPSEYKDDGLDDKNNDAPTKDEGGGNDAPTKDEGGDNDAPTKDEGSSSDQPAKDEGNSNDQPAKDEDDGSIQNGKPSIEEKPQDDSNKEDAPKNDPPKEDENHASEADSEEEKPLNMDLETYNKEIEMLDAWDLSLEELRQWKDQGDKENYDDVAPGYETDGKGRDAGTISRLQHEKDMRKMWRYAYRTTAK
ncbi:hypothetical protein THARTR1_06291 [Trichoderma harzianum]|uniref:Uncharacterized protein n=1 Tax=Trichoderma harzianum TaxID=5544 RepID=A0A2K0U5P6_TRIHA|nr:hypothetical protein THARTR1_06291 [Trichoderma harzianum]